MFEWLGQTFEGYLTWRGILLGVALFIVTFTLSLGFVTFLLVKLPANYFHTSHSRDFLVDRHKFIRWCGLVVKNVLGAVLVGLGLIMALPGVPGQGILTILIGLMLLDFPGKRQLEYKIVSRPKVQRAINKVRTKFGKPPLLLD